MHKPCITKRMKNHILIMDGAMGTMLQEANLTATDFGGKQYEGCNDYLNLTAPTVIASVHRAYFEAGADIVCTNTFGATKVVLDDYQLEKHAYEVNKCGAFVAACVAKEFSTEEWPRYIAGSIGPTTKMLSLTGGITWDELVVNFEEQALGLIDGGVDFFLIETAQDTLNVKAAYLGIKQAQQKRDIVLPLMISGTIEANGSTLSGQNIEALYISLAHMNPFAIGLNCATGPGGMTDHMRTLSAIASCGVSCYPNAGLPDEHGCYNESPETLALKLAKFATEGWLNIVGGCCGTTPDHIAAIRCALTDIKPRVFSSSTLHAISGLEPLIYDDPAGMRPILVGERTNVIGSRKFKNLIRDGQFEFAADLARKQVAKGAQVIDVCLSDAESNERTNMEAFIKVLVHRVKVPLMIDTLDSQVAEIALKHSQGKCIINSINLESGQQRFFEVAQLIKRYGAAVVVGTIDEEKMAITAADKLQVAKRAYDLLTVKYGIMATDIIFDPLVFPVGTGDEAYLKAAKETIEGIRLLKKAFPKTQTIIGLSNISFGLPPVGREVLNAVFLHHCVKAGLDYAIVNTEKLKRFATISEVEVQLANQLLFETSDKTLAAFADFYRDKHLVVNDQTSPKLTLEERFIQYVVTGTKNGLTEDLALAQKQYETPLAIVNGPLMAGMMKVGELFNDNQLIVAEVLQSASVMKAAVSYLETQMVVGQATATKGKFLLATVKGDVHDIGKNLVEIILSNNGYDVIDLGIKVESQAIINAISEHKPDVVGLSGLLVKSAEQMIITASDMKAAEITTPIIVGGAALSQKFAEKIATAYDGVVLYAKDAMHGLELTNQLISAKGEIKQPPKLTVKHLFEVATTTKLLANEQNDDAKEVPIINQAFCTIIPKNLNRQLIEVTPSQLYPYLNHQRLYHYHLGVKQGDSAKKAQLKRVVDRVLAQADAHKWLRPCGVYQFFPAQSKGEQIIVYHPYQPQQILELFEFPRQKKEPYLCLADYIKSVDSKEMDYMGFFVVTSGITFTEQAERFRSNGDYLESHVLNALALEVAEGMATYVHEKMRTALATSPQQGKRFSFGYPACPDLALQAQLFNLLQPETIGVTLTDSYMMQPTASVSGLVFAHTETNNRAGEMAHDNIKKNHNE